MFVIVGVVLVMGLAGPSQAVPTWPEQTPVDELSPFFFPTPKPSHANGGDGRLDDICFWKPYEVNSNAPSEALPFGAYKLPRTRSVMPLYLIRLSEGGKGGPTVAYQWLDHPRRAHGVRDFTERLFPEKQTHAPAEIFSVRNLDRLPEGTTMRWRSVGQIDDIRQCCTGGRNSLNDTTYVARFKTRSLPDGEHGIMPGVYSPVMGMTLGEDHGTQFKTDVELLCMETHEPSRKK